MIDLLHLNKHITKAMIRKSKELILQKSLEANPDS
jgi:hypothetical protein